MSDPSYRGEVRRRSPEEHLKTLKKMHAMRSLLVALAVLMTVRFVLEAALLDQKTRLLKAEVASLKSELEHLKKAVLASREER